MKFVMWWCTRHDRGGVGGRRLEEERSGIKAMGTGLLKTTLIG